MQYQSLKQRCSYQIQSAADEESVFVQWKEKLSLKFEVPVNGYDYVIGDIQGCYDPFMRLLDNIQFNENIDRLWFVGDLVNRGPDSLKVIRFIKNLKIPPYITLGNHDLHLLARYYIKDAQVNADDTLHEILHANDIESIANWLRHQHLLVHSPTLNFVMTHAGIAPQWDLEQAKHYAHEVEDTLRSSDFIYFFQNMYGNHPHCWDEQLTGIDRIRLIVNYFTRMRFCDKHGCLALHYKGGIKHAPHDLIPWFLVPNRKSISADLVFGHWAALQGCCPVARIHAIDTGCLWGGALTALRLQDKQRFTS